MFNCKIKPVNPKGNQSWTFTGSTDAEVPILCHLMGRNQPIRKDSDDGKNWRQEEKGTTEETVGWHHWLNGHEFEQALGDGEGQGSLECCSPWGRKKLDMTQGLDNTVQPKILSGLDMRIKNSVNWPQRKGVIHVLKKLFGPYLC